MVSIVFSFLCSLWESVLLSISPSYMQIKLDEGGQVGEILEKFKSNIEKPLAAILTLNTIAHTVGAIGVGKEATKIWATSNPIVTGFVVPAVMTIAILIFSEIIPKTIGATNWRKLTPFTVYSLKWIIACLNPVIVVCQSVTHIFNKGASHAVFSRADLIALAQIGSNEGALEKSERDFIYNMMHFRNHSAREIMTPRTVLASAPQDMKFKDFIKLKDEMTFSRILLRADKDSESIIGYILRSEALEHIVKGEGDKILAEARRPIITVKDTQNIYQMFEYFIKKRIQISLVQDKYDSIVGIVTLEDIIEALLGTEIVDEDDIVVNMRDLAKKHWQAQHAKIKSFSKHNEEKEK